MSTSPLGALRKNNSRVALIRGRSLGELIDMASKKKSDGSGIQQAAGLIRYFDEESEDSWKITPGQVYFACIALAGFFYLVNQGVVQAIWNLF